MNIIWRDFERKVRALHRADLGKSPALRREFRNQRKHASSVIIQVMRRGTLPAFWAWLFVLLVAKQNDLPLALGIISLWAAGAAAGWGHHWFQQFYGSEDLVVLNHLPLDDRQIFSFQLQRYVRSAGWIAWEMFLAYAALAVLVPGSGPPVYAFGLAAVLETLLVMALALHAASRLHMLPLGTLAGLFRTTAILLLVLGAQKLEFTRFIVQASEWFIPTGWVNHILLATGRDPVTLILLVPIIALIYLARFSFERLRGFYSLEGIEFIPAPPSAPAGTAEDELTAESFRKPGPTEIEEHIAARSFLQGVNWESAGPVERWIARLLDARERIITEFLVAQNPGWTRSLQWSFWMWLAMTVVTLALGHYGGPIIFFAAYLLAAASLPLFGGNWRGIRQIASGTVFLPGYALYPISFNTIAGILLKVNLMRIFAASPFLVSFAAVAGYKLGTSPVEGAIVAVKLLTVLVSVQPLFILFPISSTTNDTSRVRAFWWVLVFAPLLLILLGAAAGVFISRSAAGVLGCYIAILVISSLMFLLYRRAYRIGRFDLLSERSQR